MEINNHKIDLIDGINIITSDERLTTVIAQDCYSTVSQQFDYMVWGQKDKPYTFAYPERYMLHAGYKPFIRG